MVYYPKCDVFSEFFFRKSCWTLFGYFFLLLSETVVAADRQNLQSVRDAAITQQLPIVLYFSLASCDYCSILEEEVLQPMIKGHQFEGKVVFIELKLDAEDVIDFLGETVEPVVFAQRYGQVITPTIVFVDFQGQTLIDSIVGMPNLDYFGFEFREMMQKAREKLILRQ